VTVKEGDSLTYFNTPLPNFRGGRNETNKLSE